MATSRRYMAGNPLDQNDDYCIEIKDSENEQTKKQYDLNSQYRSMVKKRDMQSTTKYGNPIKQHIRKSGKTKQLKRETGYERD